MNVKYYDIKANDEDKRIRVYFGQLMQTVLENINLSNHLFHVGCYHMAGIKLAAKYPDRYDEIAENFSAFWSLVQIKLKNERNGKR